MKLATKQCDPNPRDWFVDPSQAGQGGGGGERAHWQDWELMPSLRPWEERGRGFLIDIFDFYLSKILSSEHGKDFNCEMNYSIKHIAASLVSQTPMTSCELQ
jgi:hypothetical protein